MTIVANIICLPVNDLIFYFTAAINLQNYFFVNLIKLWGRWVKCQMHLQLNIKVME